MLAVPGGVASWRFESNTGLARWRRSEDTRRADYYRNLAVTREPAERADLLERGARVAESDAHYERGIDLARGAIEIYENLGFGPAD